MARSPQIPALPLAYVRALQLLRDPDATVEQLTAIANDDPAFMAALFRAANSAESAPLRRIQNSRDAVVRLGATDARRAILGVTLQQAFRGAAGSHIDEGELWRHLSGVAVMAEEISWGGVRYTEAFTAGLLHDVGRQSLASDDPVSYAKVVALAARGVPPLESERRLFGVDHAEWGTTLVREWGFPDEIADAIANHHDGEASGLAWAIANARRATQELGIGDGLAPPEPPPVTLAAPPGVVEELGGSEVVLARIDQFRRVVHPAA